MQRPYTGKCLLVAVVLIAFLISPAVFAQGSSAKAPGQEMQEKCSVKGTSGASGYAPGQEMHAKGSKRGTEGASGYAPGQTTCSGMRALARPPRNRSNQPCD